MWLSGLHNSHMRSFTVTWIKVSISVNLPGKGYNYRLFATAVRMLLPKLLQSFPATTSPQVAMIRTGLAGGRSRESTGQGTGQTLTSGVMDMVDWIIRLTTGRDSFPSSFTWIYCWSVLSVCAQQGVWLCLCYLWMCVASLYVFCVIYGCYKYSMLTLLCLLLWAFKDKVKVKAGPWRLMRQ